MGIDDGGLTRQEHDELRDLVLAGSQSIRPAGSRRGILVGAAIALLLVGALVGGVLSWAFRTATPPAVVVTGTPVPSTVWSGWVAFSAGEQDGDIYLVKGGSLPHRILGSDTDKVDQVCPAFSPDGARLVSGQVTDEGTPGVKAALMITRLSASGEPSGTTTLALDGVTRPPCAIWSADGRWLAFGAETSGHNSVTEVWVVDSETNAIRRLTGLPATDLEWAPTASDLFIVAEGITVYSAATGTTHRLDDTSGAEALAVSPDGRSLAVQHPVPTGSSNRPADLELMGVDGSGRRILVSGYTVDYGIGPVWSPDGTRVAFQRRCDTYVDDSGTSRACVEEHVVVVVIVVDDDPLGPSGTQTVIAPPRTTVGGQSRQWFPYSASWSPDGRTLLYLAWSALGSGLLAVPVDGTTPPVVLEDALGVAGHGGEPWNAFQTSPQSWSRQRG